MRPVCVIIRDGYGHNDLREGNAVRAAHTPNSDAYMEKYPWTLLDASGEPVGLPDGYMGSSEVGHLNIGAGRIVIQELKRIDDALKDGSLYGAEKWQSLIQHWQANTSRLHFIGLLQDEGVHAHQDHLFQLMRRAREEYPAGEIIVHVFTDGRDSAPRSALGFLAQLDMVLNEVGNARIGTLMGRYYGMDRGQNWALTDRAYETIVSATGNRADTASGAVESSYEQDKTPDGVDMFDEYILPAVIGDYAGLQDGDSIMHYNYRQDRAKQLTMAFLNDDYPGTLSQKPRFAYVGFTRYFDEMTEYVMSAMGGEGGQSMENLLGEVIAAAGLKQLRIAETQKFPHVTSFMNGKATTPYAGEEDVEIKSDLDPSSFASHPEMEAERVTEELLRRLVDNPYAFIAVNFANPDMVGHTGNFAATKKACEVVDACVGRVITRLLELDGQIILMADHGNADEMLDAETGMVKTCHSLYPVACIHIANDSPGKPRIIQRGKLADVAPTVLTLMGLPRPAEMTGDLLVSQR